MGSRCFPDLYLIYVEALVPCNRSNLYSKDRTNGGFRWIHVPVQSYRRLDLHIAHIEFSDSSTKDTLLPRCIKANCSSGVFIMQNFTQKHHGINSSRQCPTPPQLDPPSNGLPIPLQHYHRPRVLSPRRTRHRP